MRGRACAAGGVPELQVQRQTSAQLFGCRCNEAGMASVALHGLETRYRYAVRGTDWRRNGSPGTPSISIKSMPSLAWYVMSTRINFTVSYSIDLPARKRHATVVSVANGAEEDIRENF